MINSDDTNEPRRPAAPDVEVADDSDESPAEPVAHNPDSLRGRFRDPGVRNYLFAGLAALSMVFVTMFAQGSDIGGVLLVVIGTVGMVFRWTSAPPVFLLVLGYFMVCPFGFPDVQEYRLRIEQDRFRVDHAILIFSTVVYVITAYRLLGITSVAVPFDIRYPKKTDKPTRRPVEMILPGEIPRMLYLTIAVVFVGQFVWLLVTVLEVDVGSFIPLKIGEPRTDRRGGTAPGELPLPATRFILVAGMLFFGALLARLVFGYWRLRTMSPAEGRMVLLEVGWDEARRERVRIEKWRIWARKRFAERAKKNEETPQREQR